MLNQTNLNDGCCNRHILLLELAAAAAAGAGADAGAAATDAALDSDYISIFAKHFLNAFI